MIQPSWNPFQGHHRKQSWNSKPGRGRSRSWEKKTMEKKEPGSARERKIPGFFIEAGGESSNGVSRADPRSGFHRCIATLVDREGVGFEAFFRSRRHFHRSRCRRGNHLEQPVGDLSRNCEWQKNSLKTVFFVKIIEFKVFSKVRLNNENLNKYFVGKIFGRLELCSLAEQEKKLSIGLHPGELGSLYSNKTGYRLTCS